jgi:phosphate starvation-inducible PhoH-like protein
MRRAVELQGAEVIREVLGHKDSHVRRIRAAAGVSAVVRGNKLVVEGDPEGVERAEAALVEIRKVVESLGRISKREVDRIVEGITFPMRGRESAGSGEDAGEAELTGERLHVGRGREVEPRTVGQVLYVKTMRENDIVLSVGPAGTGKTYLAVAMALAELEAGRVSRIALARPAVEAGESLGFLPGDYREKVIPYLRPLYDALQDMLSRSAGERLLSKGVVEIVPLAYMRGRTLGHAFVILDEAQNTTASQMLMFLTRLGIGSRAVVTGDVTQMDIEDPEMSGLVQACRRLDGVDGVGMVHLSEKDIVRHRLVREIIARWSNSAPGPARPGGSSGGDPSDRRPRPSADKW